MRTRRKSSLWTWALTDLQAFVAGQPAADLHLQRARRQVELVVHDHQWLRSSMP